jgi:hypothetical protein
MAKRYRTRRTDYGYGPSVCRRNPTATMIYGLFFFGGVAYLAFLIIGVIINSIFF